MPGTYRNIIIEIRGQIGLLYLNRPKALNAFGDGLLEEVTAGLRELNEHPDTIFTVLTGKGRFFSAGADIKGGLPVESGGSLSDAEKKMAGIRRFAPTLEMMRHVVDHKKVLIVAMNGPGVGGGAAWFQPYADLVFAAKGSWLQIPFSALALVPENGSVFSYAQSMGVHRANEFLMFGRKMDVEELQQWGMVNTIFPSDGFHDAVVKYLQEQLDVNDGKAMLETKRLANAPLRAQRMLAVYDSWEALAERSVDGEAANRFALKIKELEAKAKSKI